tara:strand:- start:1140 stop:2243 length:1104 start_codon:yes stop_codon:yes gene_type:complete
MISDKNNYNNLSIDKLRRKLDSCRIERKNLSNKKIKFPVIFIIFSGLVNIGYLISLMFGAGLLFNILVMLFTGEWFTESEINNLLYASKFTILPTLILAPFDLLPRFWINKKNSSTDKLISEVSDKNKLIRSILEKKEKEAKNLKIDKELSLKKSSLLSMLDTDGNKKLDLIEEDNTFLKILKNNNKKILELEKSENRDFTIQFIKLSEFLKSKRDQLKNLFDQIQDIKDIEKVFQVEKIIKREMYLYNLFLLESLHMISSLVDDDRITYSNLYVRFDKLNIWNSNFENQMLEKLDLLNSNINKLIDNLSIYSKNIIDSLEDISYMSKENNIILENQLKSIDSSIKVNNMISAINTYQNYKANKKLK